MKHLLLSLCLALLAPLALAIEEPSYEVTQRLGDVELRQYAPYVVAEVRVEATADSAGNQAFPILAAYIFGKNKGERRLEMTAPVTQVPEPKKLAMTAPVTQVQEEGGFRVQFVLPREVSLASAPEPIDPRVQIREVPGGRLAVIRYSGRWTQANYLEHLDRLQRTLREAGLRWMGEPVWSRYNAPISPPFLRRNEIWLTLP